MNSQFFAMSSSIVFAACSLAAAGALQAPRSPPTRRTLPHANRPTQKKGFAGRESLGDPRFQDDRSKAVYDCTRWYLLRGGERNGVEAKMTDHGLGLVASADVAAGEAVLTTPRAWIVSAEDAPLYLSATRDDPAADLVTETAAVSARFVELEGDGMWEPYLAALPTAAELGDVPALWPDDEASGLLAGTQTGRSRAELLATWRSDLEAINGRRRLHDPSSPEIPWRQWRYYEALVMSRGSSLPGVGYAVLPFIDLANHDDAPNAKLRVDEADGYCASVSLTAARDLVKGEQVCSSYAGGEGPMDALLSLQAFGWLALGDDERPLVESCSVDVAMAIRSDDALGEVKLGLLDAAPGGGRAVLTTTGNSDVDDRAHAGALRDLLCGLRLVSMDEAALTAEILENEAPEDSPWALGERVSDANEAAAVQAGSGLLRRMIAASDAEFETRTKAGVAAANASPEGLRRATLARATAEGERAALCTLLALLEGRPE